MSEARLPSDAGSQPLVARTWHGAVPAARAGDYLHYLEKTGVRDALGTPGNRGVLLLQRADGDVAHFQFLSFWESEGSIVAFAGEDIEQARYYPEDRNYLLELEPTVTHYQAWVKA